jgi:hypothetical protein
MACDHQYTHNGGIVFKGNHKMLVLEKEVAEAFFNAKKAIVGYAGRADAIGSVFSWLSEPTEKPPKLNNSELIVLTSNKQIYTSFNLTDWIFVDKPYYSIGSGSHFALGAMAASKGPSKAIEVASGLDPGTGMGITEIKL